MIKGVLEQQEIPAYIQGEHLQSGMGELPAISGFVKISVDNTNVIAAKKIINDWELAEAFNEKSSQKTQLVNENQFSTTNFLLLIASFALGAVLMNLYMQGPVTYNGIDLNDDKVNDISWTFKNNIATKSEGDFNFDSTIDDITTYKNGLLDTTKVDSDFDGIFDTEYQYLNERVSMQKTDTNHDDKIDLIMEFGSNALDFNTTIFNPRTNLIKKIQHYKMNKLVSAELDTNNDGNLDVVISYDFAEEEASRKPLNSN